MSLDLDTFMYRGKALKELCPNEPYTLYEDGTIVWDNLDSPKPTEAEIEAKTEECRSKGPLEVLRIKRNILLAETDVWVLPDRTPTQEQLNYRQALRDITNSYTSMLDEGFAWPEKPALGD